MAKEPANWFRKLQDERLEVSLRANGVKLRASGPEATIYELVEWFEQKTGRAVAGTNWHRPLRTGPRPMPGQLAITELPSDDTVTHHATA